VSEAYAAFIEAQLSAERAQRESINTRTASLLTTAVSVCTLAVAVLAVFKGTGLVHANGVAKWFLLFGLFLLLASAVFAMRAGRPIDITTVSPDSLYAMVNDHWDEPQADALRNTAYANVVILKSLRPGTTRKNRIYFIGIACQIAAIVFFTFSVVAEVLATKQEGGAAPIIIQQITTATDTMPSPIPTVNGRG
jgi:hypothetical protein